MSTRNLGQISVTTRPRNLGKHDVRVIGFENAEGDFRGDGRGSRQDRCPIAKGNAATHLHVVAARARIGGETTKATKLGRSAQSFDDFRDRDHEVRVTPYA